MPGKMTPPDGARQIYKKRRSLLEEIIDPIAGIADKILGRGKLPLKLPKYAKREDMNDPKPGHRGHFRAGGVFYLGNDMQGYELWLTPDDIKAHILVYGATGSGKAATLHGMACNALAMGSGLCYIDPKGDAKLMNELFLMARRFSREDDFLALDFAAGGKKSDGPNPFRASNTFNPFADAKASEAANILTSLLPKDKGKGNSIFQQKAMALISTLIPVLCALRSAKAALPLTDMGEVSGVNREKGALGSDLSIAMIRDYLEPVMCASLVYPLKRNNEPEECDEVAKLVEKPLLDALRAALTSLNYVPGPPIYGKPGQSGQQAYLDQFGYAKGYFGAPLASLSGMYGHLLNSSQGEIDMYDCLFNRRILANALPPLEKSPQECENLGKIMLAAVKNSMSGGLSSHLEGKTREATETLPSSSDTPGIIIVDDYAAIMMPGFEIILTQARSLGLMAVIASQNYDNMREKDEKAAQAVVENTKTKLFMAMASAKDAWSLSRSLFGNVRVEVRDLNNPEDRGTMENMEKITLRDLMNQIEGEFHAFYKGEIIRGRSPRMIPKAKTHHHFRLNRFVRMDFADASMENIAKWMDEYEKAAKS